MTGDWDEARRRAVADGTLLGRLCDPLEFARVVRFLLSEDASYVTGAVVDVTASGLFGH
ncbi:3-ketoacyl-(acyl-carrier-protein) reductase [compost metagenome]